MRNEAWLYLFCPDDWQIETPIRYKIDDKKKTIIPDVKFRDEDGILNAVEIDRTQMMNVNSEKIKRYGNLLCIIKINITEKYRLFIFFTVTKYREKKLEELAAKYDVFVKVYVIGEI